MQNITQQYTPHSAKPPIVSGNNPGDTSTTFQQVKKHHPMDTWAICTSAMILDNLASTFVNLQENLTCLKVSMTPQSTMHLPAKFLNPKHQPHTCKQDLLPIPTIAPHKAQCPLPGPHQPQVPGQQLSPPIMENTVCHCVSLLCLKAK